MCICASVPRVKNHTRVLVIQHPRERTHAIGTARLARLGLTNSRVEVAWDANAREDELPDWVPANTALLYPGPGAVELETLAADQHPKNLMVIDGTWHTAKSLFRDKRWLQRLPRVRLSPTTPSRYRLRREPQNDFVSTIEAIVQALQILEPETQGLDTLLKAFDAMIDAQLEHVERGVGRPRSKLLRRPLAERRTPRAIVEALDRLVVLYVESSRLYDGATRELAQVTALSLATGATFDQLIIPRTGMPSELLLKHMQIGAEAFETALTPEDFALEWHSFLSRCGSAPLPAAWNQGSLDLVAAATSTPVSYLSLKSAYRGVHGAGMRELSDIIVHHELMPEANTFRGRAATRLAQAAAVARYLHDRIHSR